MSHLANPDDPTRTMCGKLIGEETWGPVTHNLDDIYCNECFKTVRRKVSEPKVKVSHTAQVVHYVPEGPVLKPCSAAIVTSVLPDDPDGRAVSLTVFWVRGSVQPLPRVYYGTSVDQPDSWHRPEDCDR